MNLLDVLIVLAAIAYGFGGYRSGAVIGIFSLVGFFGGAVHRRPAGQPLGSRISDGRAQVPVAIVCVLVLATLGQLLAVYVGGRVKEKVRPRRGPAVGPRHRRGARRAVGAAGVVDDRGAAGVLAVPASSRPRPASRRSCAASTTRCPTASATCTRLVAQLLRPERLPAGVRRPAVDLHRGRAGPAGATCRPRQQRVVDRAHRSVFKIYGQAPSAAAPSRAPVSSTPSTGS